MEEVNIDNAEFCKLIKSFGIEDVKKLDSIDIPTCMKLVIIASMMGEKRKLANQI